MDTLKEELHQQGYAKVPREFFSLDATTVQRLRDELDELFHGQYHTGVYPDEIHWRQGISREDVTRELCNAWKASLIVRDLVCSEILGSLACQLMDWSSSRIGQDDVLHKPPQSNPVGFHQDGTYISDNFLPRDNNMLTMWIALDDADDENGALQYAPESHLWDMTTVDKKIADNVGESSFHVGKHDDHTIALRRAAILAGLSFDQVIQSLETVSVPAGQMVVHHQDVWHGSGPNRSLKRPRRAIVAHLINGQVRWRHNPPPHYIYGRYYLRNESIPRQDFFPVTYAGNRRSSSTSNTEHDGDFSEELQRPPWLT